MSEAPFNMAIMFYIRLTKVMDEKDAGAMSGNLERWFNGLRTIFRNISFKLTTDERKEFDELFNTASRLMIAGYNSRHSFVFRQKIGGVLDEIDVKIMQVMDKYKMIFPNIKVGSLGQLEKDLGL